MENTSPPPVSQSSDISGAKLGVGILWLVSLVVVGGLGYMFGMGASPVEQKKETSTANNVLGSVNQISAPPTTAPQVSAAPVANTAACAKTGYAQKWEYLKSYTIKEGDKLADIAKYELGDESRINEILQINGVGPLVVGSTLYLPPEIVTKSSGNLKQVNGKLIEKSASMWHLSFNETEKGMGILIPSYWFREIKDKDSYMTGDCLTVLLDDGNTVFSVAKQ